MSDWSPPVLGLTDTLVVWRDGTVVCNGILGDMSPETLAREAADRAHKEFMRAQPNVVLLEDWKK